MRQRLATILHRIAERLDTDLPDQYVIRNTSRTPVVKGPMRGAILPYISRDIDGHWVAVRGPREQMEQLRRYGVPMRVPRGLRTTPLED